MDMYMYRKLSKLSDTLIAVTYFPAAQVLCSSFRKAYKCNNCCACSGKRDSASKKLAQPIRLLLHYVGENYDDVLYEVGDAPDYSKEQWRGVRHTFGLPFPNLPYYIDGDIKVTQSNAIIRYIARRHDLLGKTEQEKVAVDVLLDQAMDFRNSLVNLVYSDDYEKLKDGYFEELLQKLQEFEAFLGDKPFFTGSEITAPDFVLYELLDQHRLMKEDCLTDFPKLLAFLDRIEAEPNIKAYMASDKFIRRPVNNKFAQFK